MVVEIESLGDLFRAVAFELKPVNRLMQAYLVQQLLEVTALVLEPSFEGGRAAPQQAGDVG